MSGESCEGFEIAIEMRRHGAGNADASARLDRHLAECERCGEFDRLGAETESRLRADAEETRAKANLEKLRAQGRSLALSRWKDVGAFYFFIGIAFLVRTGLRAAGLAPGNASLVQAALGVMTLAIAFVEMRRRQRAIEEAWSTDTLFHEMRVDVRERLIGAGFFVALFLGFAVFFAGDQLLGQRAVPGGLSNTVFFAGLAALSLYVGVVRIPALVRERREIPFVADSHQHSSEWSFGLL